MHIFDICKTNMKTWVNVSWCVYCHLWLMLIAIPSGKGMKSAVQVISSFTGEADFREVSAVPKYPEKLRDWYLETAACHSLSYEPGSGACLLEATHWGSWKHHTGKWCCREVVLHVIPSCVQELLEVICVYSTCLKCLKNISLSGKILISQWLSCLVRVRVSRCHGVMVSPVLIFANHQGHQPTKPFPFANIRKDECVYIYISYLDIHQPKKWGRKNVSWQMQAISFVGKHCYLCVPRYKGQRWKKPWNWGRQRAQHMMASCSTCGYPHHAPHEWWFPTCPGYLVVDFGAWVYEYHESSNHQTCEQ